MKKMSYLLVLLSLFALVACGGGDAEEETAPEPQTIEVTMHDIYYGEENTNVAEPPTWTVNAGAPATLTMENVGVLEHTWVIIEQGAELPDVVDPTSVEDIALYTSGSVAGGETTSTQFRPPSEAGEYLVICSVAGHYPAMQGKLIVE